MSKSTKYILPSILFTLTSVLSAQNQNQNDCPPDPCCTPCPPRDPCAKCAQLWPSCGPDWIVTPNAGPCVSCGADVFVTAEFIYWAVRQDGMEYAFTFPTETTVDTLSGLPQGKFFSADDGLIEPGFKVGLGMMFDCDGWDLYANYTWLRPDNTETARPSPGLSLFVNVGENGVQEGITSVQSKWKLWFNVIDLELGRNFFISQCLHLRPHFGFKGHWQEQKWDILAPRVEPNDGMSSNIIDNLKMCYWGVGLRAGLDSAWHFTPCFSLVGEVAASVLWQRFEPKTISYEQIFLPDDTVNFEIGFNSKNDFYSIKSVIELYLGLRWEDWFCCDEYHYSIEAGWELQWWGDQNQLLRAPFVGGDLGLQGLTVKLRFDF